MEHIGSITDKNIRGDPHILINKIMVASVKKFHICENALMSIEWEIEAMNEEEAIDLWEMGLGESRTICVKRTPVKIEVMSDEELVCPDKMASR